MVAAQHCWDSSQRCLTRASLGVGGQQHQQHQSSSPTLGTATWR